MKPIRIGTRDSELALWQANTVKSKLETLGYTTQLKPIKSTGDLVLNKPLYDMGITGIFTRALDTAMLNGEIDIAVHSFKDVPTVLPKGIVQAAVLERAASEDILVFKNQNLAIAENNEIIATGSLRRKAQWLHKYPNHMVVDLRGNVNTRLKKLENNGWTGAIFAQAGLERISLKPEHHIVLDWMIPAPAQGAMMVVAMEDSTSIREALSKLNHVETEICTHVEREFLNILEGGCTAPIGAYAQIEGQEISFRGALFSIDGSEKLIIERNVLKENYSSLGKNCALQLLNEGGTALMQKIKKVLK